MDPWCFHRHAAKSLVFQRRRRQQRRARDPQPQGQLGPGSPSLNATMDDFEEYAEKAKTLPESTSNENKLILYGPFKQAIVGDVNTYLKQMRAVKDALHVATVPSCGLVCRDDEQNRVLEFCMACVEQEKAGSLYVCSCPGTWKTVD